MAADRNVRVECLNRHQAMELFKNRLEENSQCLQDREVQKLAESFGKECAGLPLVLIITAGTMASKTTVGEWHYAQTTLQKNAAEFSDDVISIHRLIQQWIGEGYIDGFDEWEDAVNIGYNIIGVLKSTCLLESPDGFKRTSVKMHDVIRDLAHWIAREYGRENDKILLKISEQVTRAPNATKWVNADTISMMYTGITHLHDIPKCSILSTFLCNHNYHLYSIPDNFFIYMHTLRFLDFSNNESAFKCMPHNFSLCLPTPRFPESSNNELASDFASSTKKLGCLPSSIGELVSLEYLDLSNTRFEKELPVEMKKLLALKYIFLGESSRVPLGVIKNLVNLRALELNVCGFGKEKDDDRLAGIEELQYLPQLKHLQVLMPSAKDLQVFVGKDALTSCTWSLTSTVLKDIRKLKLSSSVSCTHCLSLGCMEKIRKLVIADCREIKELVIDNKEISSFKNMNLLVLFNLPHLIVSWDSKNCVGPFFTNLPRVRITGCDTMVDLTWLSLAPKLEHLIVSDCKHMERILSEEGFVAYDKNTFSQLKELHLYSLPCLKSISSYVLPSRFLERVYVRQCPELKRLLLDSNNSKKLLLIEGSSNWWNNLEWDNESAK